MDKYQFVDGGRWGLSSLLKMFLPFGENESEENYQPVDVGVALQTDAVIKVKMYKKVSNLFELAGVVYFDVDRATLKNKYKPVLDKMAKFGIRQERIMVETYSIFDPTGKGLSEDRRVEIYLMMPEKVEK